MTPDKSKANFLCHVDRGGNRCHIRASGLAGDNMCCFDKQRPASYLDEQMRKESTPCEKKKKAGYNE